MIKMPDIIPTSWKIGAALALVAAVVAGGTAYHSHVYHAGYDQAVADRKASDLAATTKRTQENTVLAAKQDATNVKIEKAKNEELAPVVHTVYVDRVRIGPASCGPAAATQAEDAGGGDGANPPGRLVREDIERDTRALTIAVEEDLATGRACQAWGRENGFFP